MAMIDQQVKAVKVPDLDSIQQAQVSVAYDRLADTLWVSLVGEPRPAYNAYADDDDDFMYRIDPYTGKVVGFEIERFLDRALAHRLDPTTESADG